MENSKQFPILTAEPIQEYNKNKSSLYIYSSRNNRGYELDGFAANLCHRFDGTKSLESIINEFEKELSIEKNFYQAEINSLIQDLQNNSLVEFLDKPKNAQKVD